MADPACNGRPAALFIAPIMPSDRGNGLAMRTGFLLDTYAKRFAIDLAVVPVAGGATTLTPFVEARVRRAVVLPAVAPDTHFTLIGSVADAKARLAAFRQYGRPSITARLSAELERALLGFAGEARYQPRACFAALPREPRRRVDACGRRTSPILSSIATRTTSAPIAALRCCTENGAAHGARIGPRQRPMRSRRSGVNTCRVSISCLRRRPARRACSSDRAGDTAIAVIPNVAPSSAAGMPRPQMREGRREILFVGNMGYLPNIDAAMWFATRIWPRLRSAAAISLRFVIAGNGAPREVMQLGRRPGIALAGPFEDAGRLYRRAALAVVPIRAGGGTRIKLLESATHGVPIVATRIGAEGTGFRSGQELLLADNEQDFASSCARLLTDSKLASRLVAGARRKVRRDYAAARSAKGLLDRIDPWLAKE